MAHLLNLHPPHRSLQLRTTTNSSSLLPPRQRPSIPIVHSNGLLPLLRSPNSSIRWEALQRELKCQGRFSCLFSDGRKQEQARKALESALEGKKSDFEKWNKEIEKREMGGGGTSGRGGWFGGGGWFGWFNNEHFWEEAQQAILALIGILGLYLLVSKGSVMFAIVSNSLLFALRGTRNWFSFVSSHLHVKTLSDQSQSTNETYHNQISAKESVARKWGAN